MIRPGHEPSFWAKRLLLLVSRHECPQISLRNVSHHVRPEISTAQYPNATHIISVELLSLLYSPHLPYSLNVPYSPYSPLSPKLNTPSSFKSPASPKLLYLPCSFNSPNSPCLHYPTHPIQPTFPTRPTYLLIQLTLTTQLTPFTLLTQLPLLTQHLISFQNFYTGYPLTLGLACSLCKYLQMY